jgi:hypothetical protein
MPKDKYDYPDKSGKKITGKIDTTGVTDKGKKPSIGAKAADILVGGPGPKKAASWALQKYRNYQRDRADKAAAEKKKKAAAEKAKNEARADELYGKGTSTKPDAKPVAKKPKPKPTGVVEDVATTLENIKKKKQALKDATPD